MFIGDLSFTEAEEKHCKAWRRGKQSAVETYPLRAKASATTHREYFEIMFHPRERKGKLWMSCRVSANIQQKKHNLYKTKTFKQYQW